MFSMKLYTAWTLNWFVASPSGIYSHNTQDITLSKYDDYTRDIWIEDQWSLRRLGGVAVSDLWIKARTTFIIK